ncbi:MAG: hypothetical protein QOJ24_3552 [Mycobacterium sp.]|jgi:hypothetical protein|nr:hypothetical protein [Mycobacterium sp.]
MYDPDAISEHRKRHVTRLAMATLAGAAVVALTIPSVALADPDPSPEPGPPAPSGNTFMQGPPGDPNVPAPAAADPNAPAPAAAPASEPGRVDNAAGGFSYVVPAGWKVSDARQLSYGQALLTREQPEGTAPTQPGQQGPQPANDTSVLLGRLDMKLFAGAEADNAKAATRLASDMGEFFMPFPGTRVNQANGPLGSADMPGAFSAYDVKFTDTNKPTGQIWAGVVGNATPTVAAGQPLAPRGQRNERWFVVWLGTAPNPVDKAAAATLANSIRPWSPPPPPEPDPNAPQAADPNAAPADPNAPVAPEGAPGRPPVGVGVPVDPANAPGMMPAG